MGRIRKLKVTKEQRKFWKQIEDISKEVRSWPNYKKQIHDLFGRNYSSGVA